MGNVFDLSQLNMENRRDLYTEKVEDRKRRVGHFGLRCVEPELCGEFYRDVFELIELEKPAGDPNHYLSDGKVTWRSCLGRSRIFTAPASSGRPSTTSASRSKASSAFKADLEKFAAANPSPDDRPEKNPEREVRQKLLGKLLLRSNAVVRPRRRVNRRVGKLKFKR
jgi:hypothetical protein